MHPAGTPALSGMPAVITPEPAFTSMCIRMSMITARKFHDLVPSCITSGCTDGTHDSLCSGVDHTDHFNVTGSRCWSSALPSPLLFQWRRQSLSPFSHALITASRISWMVVSEDHRSPGTDKIQIFVSIHICTYKHRLPVSIKRGVLPTLPKARTGLLHATRHQSNCFFKKFF